MNGNRDSNTGCAGNGYTGDGPWPTAATNITVNNAPVVTASAGSASHTEQIAVTVDSALTLTDTEGNNMSSATITISGNYSAASGDRLTLGSCPSGASCSGSGTQTITINGSSSRANYQTAFRSVQLDTTSDTPSTLTRTVQFSVTDTFSRVRSDTRTVTVTSTNDLPTVTAFSGTLAYTENDPATAVDNAITLADVDDTNLNRAEMEISTNCVLAEDLLEFGAVCPGGLTCTQSDACTLVVTGTATLAVYEAFLEAVTYRNTSSNPNTNDRTARLRVRDTLNGFSGYASKTITVSADSDPPTIAGMGGTLAYAENEIATRVDTSITLADVDSSNLNRAEAEISVNCNPAEDRLAVDAATCSANGVTCTQSDNCTLVFTGIQPLANYQAVLEAITYHNVSESPNTADRTVRIRVRDDASVFSGYGTTTITITPINDAPSAVDDAFTADVNSSGNELNVLVNDTDVDAGDTLSLVSVGAPSSGGTVTLGDGGACALNTLCYTPPSDFTGTNTFAYIMQDAGGLQDTATVSVGGTDTDGDGVIDFLDNCANDINAGQEDNDIDGQGDVCDSDDDNDGMSDTFETTHGLDPMNSADAGEDADGDGRTNLEEFQAGGDPNVDDVGPAFGGVENITVDAIGYFTPVTLSVVTANDVADGSRTVTIQGVVGTTGQADVEKGLFRPGLTVITYSAMDNSGNNSTLDQTVVVRPLANLLPNQVAVEGEVVRIGVSLNGEAPDPVTFDYTVSGTAGSADYDVDDTGLPINAGGTSGEIVVTLHDDGVVEGSETLVITMSNPQNAVLGNKTSHTVVINEGNLAPAVTLDVAQGVNAGPLIVQTGGPVRLTATASDLPGDTFTYDWSQLHAFLTALNGTGGGASNTFEFDPMALEPGVYDVEVSVTDSGSPAATTLARLALNLQDSSPVLTAIDSDGDGINDDVEGYRDADGNGIADYLDPFSVADTSLMPNQTGELPKVQLLQTDAGLKLRMGTVGLSTGATGALIGSRNIETYVNQLGGSSTLPKDTYRNVGGIFDFEVYGLPVGEAANVVLPLSAGILLGAEYRKFDLQNGWFTFVTNANNSILSARSVNGVCPAPGHASYTQGLTPFNNCVQLTIQDGGPNDADGQANGVIHDPGGVGVADVTPEHETPTPDDGSGGGVLHPVWLLLLTWLAAFGRRGKWLH